MNEEFYHKANLYRRIVQAKLFIDSHFAEKINIDLIAGEAYFSKFHFIRTFKEIYGFTPHQYLIQVRIAGAKKLLSRELPVEQVCFDVGFESVSTFTGLFKKKTGMSPVSFKKQQASQRAERMARPLKYIPACHIHAAGISQIQQF